MLLRIKLDTDASGPLVDIVDDVDKNTLGIGTVLTGIRPMVVRNKLNKVLNDYSVVHDTKQDDMGRRIFKIMARNGSVEMARLEVCLNEHTYACKIIPIERKRGLTAELEVATQRPRKAS